MRQRWYINKISFRILFPALAGIVLYLLMLMVFGNLESLSETFFSQEALFIVFLTYINHEWAIFLLGRDKSRNALDSASPFPRILFYLLLLLTTILISSLAILAYFIAVIGYYHFMTELITIDILMVLFQLLVQMYYLSRINIRRYHELSIEKEEIQGRQLEFELESFKSEMNPDLLMECLENLLVLMQKDVKRSDNYIQALSNQYRYLLDSRRKEFVPMDVELEAARELVFLLNISEDEKISLEREGMDSKIPVLPGTIHSIIYNVENSMILNSLNPLIIKLSQDKDGDIFLRYPDRPRLRPGPTINIEKLNQSYLHYTNREIESRQNGTEIEWIIPRLPEIIQ